MIFERAGVAGYKNLSHDKLTYLDLATGLQPRSYDIVREHHALSVSCMARRPCGRAASGSQILLWRLGIGVQYGPDHAPGRGNGLQSPQSLTFAQLDGAL